MLARRLPLIVRLAPLSDSSLSRPSTKKTPDNETRSPRLPLLLLNHLRPLRRRPLLRAPRLRRRGADHGGARGSPWVRVVADQGVQAVPGAGERRGAVHEVRELG